MKHTRKENIIIKNENRTKKHTENKEKQRRQENKQKYIYI